MEVCVDIVNEGSLRAPWALQDGLLKTSLSDTELRRGEQLGPRIKSEEATCSPRMGFAENDQAHKGF